jgi:transposase-like protein
MPIKPEHLDELLSGYEKPEDLFGEDGLFKQLKKALLERALGAELTHHLGYERGDPAGRGTGNHRPSRPSVCWPRRWFLRACWARL